MFFRPFTNYITATRLFKIIVGFSISRKIPELSKVTLREWEKKHKSGSVNLRENKRTVYLFADEFTDFNESDIGIKTILLLEKLGYEVIIPKHRESGRTFLSKGLLKTAKKVATENVLLLKELISEETPLIGIEPSAILSFRDEYPEIVDAYLSEDARKLGNNSLMLEEFICKEFENGKISRGQFSGQSRLIKLHGHCQQKAIASTSPTIRMLSIPVNHLVEEIHDGCCGMAGSFGYEKEHYELSMKIGEMVLFPVVRKASDETIIVAPGTSCRHHIAESTGRKVLHPVEVLFNAIL
jgi:Fe-S oxidoreductase